MRVLPITLSLGAAMIAAAAALTSWAPPAQAQGQQVFQVPITGKLPVPTQMHGTAVVGDRVYFFGGNSSAGWTNACYSGEVLPNGQIGNWRDETPLPELRGYFMNSVEVVNNRIYIVGGSLAEKPDSPDNERATTQDVLWNIVQPDGRLGPWQRSEPFPGRPVSCLTSGSSDRFLYVIGGYSRSVPVDDIHVAEFDATGAPTRWRTVGKLPIALWFHGSAILDRRLYVWGGLPQRANNPANARTWSTEMLPDGNIGPWRDEAPMPVPTYSAGVCGFNDYIVSCGGRYGGGQPTNVIWFARLHNGRIVQWESRTTNLESTLYHSLGLDRTRSWLLIVGGRFRNAPGTATPGRVIDTVQTFVLPQPAASQLAVQTASAAAPAAAAAPNPSGAVEFYTFDEARVLAVRESRPIMAMFYSPQVPACKRFFDTVVQTPTFRNLQETHALAAVNIARPEGVAVSNHYGIFRVPILVEISPQGNVLRLSPTDLSSELELRQFLTTRY